MFYFKSIGEQVVPTGLLDMAERYEAMKKVYYIKDSSVKSI